MIDENKVCKAAIDQKLKKSKCMVKFPGVFIDRSTKYKCFQYDQNELYVSRRRAESELRRQRLEEEEEDGDEDEEEEEEYEEEEDEEEEEVSDQ